MTVDTCRHMRYLMSMKILGAVKRMLLWISLLRKVKKMPIFVLIAVRLVVLHHRS